MYWRWYGCCHVCGEKMKISKQIRKDSRKSKKKLPFTVRGYQIYYITIIAIVLLIGFSQVFS